MTKKNSYIKITAVCLAVCLLFTVAGCKGTVAPTETTTEPTAAPEKVLHSFRVTTDKDEPLENIGVFVYTDSTRSELITFARTDAEGYITFREVPGPAEAGYIAVLSDVPEEFLAEESYPVAAADTHIRLVEIVKPEVDVQNDTYELGDTIPDFTVIADDGTEYNLSKLLEQKKAVVLNFWFLGCEPCRNEFPYLQAAYDLFGNEIEVLALNPVDGNPQKIEQYRKELGLTFPMLSCDPAWEKMMKLAGYPTTVVIDRNGMIGLYHMGTITESGVFEDIFTHFTADDYESHVVKDIEDILSGNNADSPIEVGGVTSFEVTVKPGRLVYYNIYKVNNMYLQIRNQDAYAIYEDVTYTPRNGVVGFNVNAPDTYSAAPVIFGNSGTREITFTVTLSAYPGTYDNPYSTGLGEFEVSVSAGNDQGVYYKYNAEAEGVLTLKCLRAQSGVDYDFALYNTDTGAYRTLSGDKTEDGEAAVKINCYEGDSIRIVIATLPDSSNVYPAGKFLFEAAFEEGEIKEEEKIEIIDYAVTVTDENRNPVPGVYLYVDVAGKAQAIVTNEAGVAHVELEKGNYRVTMAVPKGYSAKTGSFWLTPQRNVLSIKLDVAEIVLEDYTVQTLDAQGQPVSGVPVMIGSRFGYTDETGTVTIQLNKDAYKAVIALPEGYTSESVWAPFLGDGEPVTFILNEDTAGELPGEGRTEYTVTVLDYFQGAARDVAVMLLKEQMPVAMKPVDEKGTAVFLLEEGEYTFELAGLDVAVYWDAQNALTAEAPSVSVSVAEAVSGEMEELYVGNAYNVTVGGTYVELQPGITNYFLFTPEEPGLYRFTASGTDVLLSYWGGSTVGLITDQTSGTDFDPLTNSFTRNVKESNLGMTCILGVTGESNCVLLIQRVGDPILDETDIVPEVYVGKTTPTSPWSLGDVSGKKLTYVDLTAPTEEVTAVFNEADGFYHLNSADGPLLYANLGPNAPNISMYVMLGMTGVGGTNFTQTFYDENGVAVRREDYTDCMMAYIANTESKYGLYPLTEDLVYMLRQGGDRKGWWDPDNGNYLFADVEGLNQENAWMFAVCYFG